MNADLLAMFGGAGLPNVGSSRGGNEGKTILNFKAGRMTTELQPNGKYLVTGDPKRGDISLVYHTSPSSSSTSINSSPTLKFEWKDRRNRTTADDLTFLPSDITSDNNISFTQVSTGREDDRVYLLSYKNTDTRYFYYMQEKEKDEDVENAVLVNQYLSDFKSAATAAGDDEYLSTLQSGNNATTTQQIDALSSILENLNTTANNASTTATPMGTASSNTATTTPTAATGQLTLADLQGAMAGLVTSTPPPTSSAANLPDVLSPQIIDESGILSNTSVQDKLLSLLPPNTSSSNNESYLREHLLSPQCLECMKTLQNALMGGPSNLQDILLNFQLDSSALSSGNIAGKNPVEIFLEAVVKSVNSEKDEENKEEDSKMEE